ncbi:MAG: hypothetical protein ABI760_07795 [Ferruginibacter sp.]
MTFCLLLQDQIEFLSHHDITLDAPVLHIYSDPILLKPVSLYK